MPGLNGRGPCGQGPMTGRGRGYCMGYHRSGYGPGIGRYYGPGSGQLPRGVAATPGDEINYLKEVAEALEKEMDAIQKRIDELTGRDNNQ